MYLDALKRAAAAGFDVGYLDDGSAQRAWAAAADAPMNARPYGYIIVTTGFGPAFPLPRLRISQNVLDRAEANDSPRPLLVASQAIERAVRDFQTQAVLPVPGGLQMYVAAYVRQHDRLVTFGVRDVEQRGMSSSARWLKRLLTPVTSPAISIARSGSEVGVRLRYLLPEVVAPRPQSTCSETA